MNMESDGETADQICGQKHIGLEKVLVQVNKDSIKMKKEDTIYNNKILYSVLENFLQIMRQCNKLFSNLKPKIEYLGSYFDGLRVGHPTEYDINLILTLPVNYNKIQLDSTGLQDYTAVILPSEFRRLFKTKNMASKGFGETQFWCDSSYRFSVSRFKSWMQGVIDAALNTLPIAGEMRTLRIKNISYRVAAKISGPANTITIYENSKNIIDVDLVPTFAFSLPKIPKQSTVLFQKVETTPIKRYFIVPKPSDLDFQWRLAFPFQERYYIHNKYNMKSTIKIIKLLRDVQGFHKLASYYIKTMFLWEATETTEDFWKINSLSFLVLHMLKKLRDCLLLKEIKNFWCPDHNLLEKIKNDTCLNWSNRLTRIINVIEKNKQTDPKLILQYLSNNVDTDLDLTQKYL